jgi:hypothetical protein
LTLLAALAAAAAAVVLASLFDQSYRQSSPKLRKEGDTSISLFGWV